MKVPLSKSKSTVRKSIQHKDVVSKKAKETRAISKKASARRIPSPYLKRMKRASKRTLRAILLSHMFHTGFKIIVGFGISLGLLYGSYHYISKSFANEVVISKSEIIARVAKLTSLPHEEPHDIVRVQDPEDLKKQNDFYKDVEEGDYILMYTNLAVIYNLKTDQVVAVKQGVEAGVHQASDIR